MVCREYQLSSVVIAQVRTSSWLDDVQIQSIYHSLLHDPLIFAGDSTTWSREQLFDNVVDTARNDLRWNPIYRTQRRTGLIQRLNDGYTRAAADMPRERLAALARLQVAVAASQQQLLGRLRELAGSRGMSQREAMAEFIELRSQATTDRSRPTNEELRGLGNIPADRATRFALGQMAGRGPVRPPMREVDQWISAAPTPGVTNPVAEVGVSSVSDRVELRYADGSTSHHERVPAELLLRIDSGQGRPVPAELAEQLRAYPVSPQSDYAGWRTRCETCGQFIGTRIHQCARLNAPIPVMRRVEVIDDCQLSMPAPETVREMVEQAEGAPVLIQVDLLEVGGAGRVAGAVQVRAEGSAITLGNDRPQRLDVDDYLGAADTLRCERCGSLQCQHTSQAREMVRRQLRSQGLMPRPEQAHDSNTDHLISITEPAPAGATAEPAQPVPVSATISFLADAEAFRSAAQEGARDGVNFIPGPTLTGYAAQATFGIELEYSGGRLVPEALVEAGIVPDIYQNSYHAAQRSGWTDWSLERDGSVAGELVTPVLSDTAEDWQRLALACQAIRGDGFGTTEYAGSHTNIGSPGYTPQLAWKLAHLVRAHEEDLFRMGRTRRSPREMGYNASLPTIQQTPWTSRTDMRHIHRQSMVNFNNSMRSGNGQRIEFRFPDASHDPGVIQAQVRLCAAMTNFVRTNDVPVGQHRPFGAAVSSGFARNMMARPVDEFADYTQSVRGLLDDLFDTDEARLQVARLWGRGNYYRTH